MGERVWSEDLYESCGCPPDKGHHHPRRFPKPLRELTPETTAGFGFLAFCEALGFNLLPWQKWLALHALELLPDGRFRFRTWLVLLPRQNGKSSFMAILIAWFLTVREVPLILGAAQNMQTASEVWESVVDLLETHPLFKGELSRRPIRTNGARAVVLTGGRRYLPIASTQGAGRGLSPGVVLLDEVREHHNWEAYSSLSDATMAQWNAVVAAVSNAGDLRSVVLNHLLAQGLDVIRNNETTGVGLFDWSAFDPDDKKADPGDFEAWRKSNPSLGYTITREAIAASYSASPLAVFLTEVLCVSVDRIDAVIDVAALFLTADPHRHTLEEYIGKSSVVLWLEVSPDLKHASLYGATSKGDSVIMQPVKTWAGDGVPGQLARELAPLCKVVAPSRICRYTGNPGAHGTSAAWASVADYPRFEYTMAQASEHAVNFSALVSGGKILHPGDGLLVAQARAAERQTTGETWRFRRINAQGAYVTALYAAAGASSVAEEMGRDVSSFTFLTDEELKAISERR